MEKKRSSFIKELINFALIIIFVVIPIRIFVAQPFVVVGTSMEPTFIDNDYLIIDEISYRIENPKRGEVIVFKYDDQGKYFIKRIIGLPGETVDMKDGTVTIFNKENPEGFTIDEPYVKEISHSTIKTTLQEDEYFVMGDNRNVSFDSRSWGPLKEEKIIGRALFRLLPLSEISIFPGKYE